MTNLIFPGSEGSESTTLGQRSYANVFRFRRDVAKGSTVGLIVTDREGEGYHNRVAGVDGLIRFTSSDTLTFQFLGSNTAIQKISPRVLTRRRVISQAMEVRLASVETKDPII